MGDSYKISNQFGIYFITCTTHQWVDVFTRNEYKEILIESLQYCQKEKGLLIYSWVIMSNHIHLIVSSNKVKLSDIIRDFKKFTATKIINAIDKNNKESRKKWILWLLKKDDKIIFWQDGYHGEEIYSEDFFNTKENYIHMNPVRAGWVEKEEEYLFSSCADRYNRRKGPIDLVSY